MNLVYTITIAAEAERAEQVTRSVEQCLAATPIDPILHTRFAKVAAWLLGMGVTCGAAPGAMLEFRLLSNDAVCTIAVAGGCASTRAADVVRALAANAGSGATTTAAHSPQALLDAIADGSGSLSAMVLGKAFVIEAKMTRG